MIKNSHNKPTYTLMLRLYFCTQSIVTPTRFDPQYIDHLQGITEHQ